MTALRAQPASGRDALVLFALALAVRLLVVAWAGTRFPPVDDGRFYHVVAERIAQGLGYTWAWPDGVVTYAAHYPVGYPGLLGAGYALFGPKPLVAMVINALFGAGAAFASHRLLSVNGSRLAAALGGLLVALHPALVLYTPALMTEGVAAASITLGAWACQRAAGRGVGALALAGVVLGASVLIRPQLLLAVPIFGLLCSEPASLHGRRVVRALAVTALALGTCLPWTARNCARLESCVFVSANGGWNLLIGTAPEGEGHFIPIEKIGVPEECREVFGEADKDRCFGRAGARAIARDPAGWLALVPLKLMRTFEYAGAAGYYLHASNANLFDDGDKTTLGVIETAYQRLVLLLAVIGVGRLAARYRRIGRWLLPLGIACTLLPLAWAAYLVIVAGALLLGSRALKHPIVVSSAALVGTTALTHAVFFGEGRYGLVVFPMIAALAGLSVLPGSRAESATAAAAPAGSTGTGFDRKEPAGDTRSAGDSDAAHRN